MRTYKYCVYCWCISLCLLSIIFPIFIISILCNFSNNIILNFSICNESKIIMYLINILLFTIIYLCCLFTYITYNERYYYCSICIRMVINKKENINQCVICNNLYCDICIYGNTKKKYIYINKILYCNFLCKDILKQKYLFYNKIINTDINNLIFKYL